LIHGKIFASLLLNKFWFGVPWFWLLVLVAASAISGSPASPMYANSHKFSSATGAAPFSVIPHFMFMKY